MNPTCQEITDSLAGFVDHEIDTEGMRAIAAHLQRCPQCSDQEKAQRSMKSVMRNPALRQGMPHDMRARLMRSLERQPERVSFGALVRRLFEFQPLPAIATAVLLVALSTALALWGGNSFLARTSDPNPLALQMNGQMEGDVVCVDCTLLTITHTPFVHDASHRLGVRCNDGHFWNILQTAKGSELGRIENIVSRRVRIKGHIFPQQHQVDITDYTII